MKNEVGATCSNELIDLDIVFLLCSIMLVCLLLFVSFSFNFKSSRTLYFRFD